jgi:broad specificity phosphatase PhoE
MPADDPEAKSANPKATRFTLVTQAPPPSKLAAVFCTDYLPGKAALARAQARSGRLSSEPVLFGPSRAAAATAEALGLVGVSEPELRAPDLGLWAGRPIADVAVDDAVHFAGWTTRLDAAPPEGESAAAVLARVGQWLEAQPADRSCVAIVHPLIARAAVTHALAVPDVWFRLDVGFLSRSVLVRRGAAWRVRCVNADL